jgi:hypothetical protein
MNKLILVFTIFSFFTIGCSDSNDNQNNGFNNTVIVCGNDILDSNETCDGTLFQPGLSCENADGTHYIGGNLACISSCNNLILTGCTVNPLWSNYVSPQNSLIYVNTPESLYYIDPGESTQLVKIGDFAGTCDPVLSSFSGFFDIAVDKDGELMGIAVEGLWRIDKDTADCTMFEEFPVGSPQFSSLSYVHGVDLDDIHQDFLIAASGGLGEWVEINPYDELGYGLFYSRGFYDNPDPTSTNYAQCVWRSSGDIVSVQIDHDAYKTYATVKCGQLHPNYWNSECDKDWLAEIRPDNGDASIIGNTGFSNIYGLGFYGDKVYGFTDYGEYILIDINTDVGSLVQQDENLGFWGAGTTTKPFVVQ